MSDLPAAPPPEHTETQNGVHVEPQLNAPELAEPAVEPEPQIEPEPTQIPAPPRARARDDRPAMAPVQSLDLEHLEPDDTFQFRDVGELAGLATSLARVGQLQPIDVRPRGGSFQVIAGFRRVAALNFLHRTHVLARVHENLSDSDAWALGLAQALESRSLSLDEIHAVRERLESAGKLSPMLRGLIDAALVVPGSDLEPEPGEQLAQQEVDLDELAADLEKRLTEISGDVSLVADLWDQLEPSPRRALLEQLKYYGDLHAYLSRLR